MTHAKATDGPNSAVGGRPTRRFAVIWFPFASQVVQTLVADFVDKLLRVTPAVEVVGTLAPFASHGGRVQFHRVPLRMHYVAESPHSILAAIAWVTKLLLFQFIVSAHIALLRPRLKGVVFYLVGPYAVLPIAVCRILGIPCAICITESGPQVAGDGESRRRAIYVLYRLSLLSATYVALESALLHDRWNLRDFEGKVLPFYVARGVDFDLFKPVEKPSSRGMAFGYMGRLSDEKGVRTLLEAASSILQRLPSARFVITGQGPLEDLVIRMVAESLDGRVTYEGWVPRAKVPEILNRLRLLVLPTSSAEGLPTILLEAMACGTPVMTTTAGAIGEVVVDDVTGFMIRNLSAEGLTESICRALQSPGLDQMAAAERDLVNRIFAPEVVDSHIGAILRVLEQRVK